MVLPYSYQSLFKGSEFLKHQNIDNNRNFMLYNSRNSFSSIGNPPYFFYGNPIDVLSNFRVSYHCTNDKKTVTTYDTTKLKYESLKTISDKETQGYNDFLLARFGAKGASFYASEYRNIRPKFLLSNLTDEEKIKRIDKNTETIELIINELNNFISETKKPITQLVDDNYLIINELIKSVVSTEEIINQINSESDKYIENKPLDKDEEKPIGPHRPPVDSIIEEPKKEEVEKPKLPPCPEKPQLPPNAIFIDLLSEQKLVLGLNDKIVLRYITNAKNTGAVINPNGDSLIAIDFNTFMEESGGYEFLVTSKKKVGKTYITIKAWNDEDKILEKRIKVTVREEPMSDKYPIITDVDENGVKWLIKNANSVAKPLYPPFFIEWEKLLYQEKQRIPATILTLEHKQEMTVNGVIVDENGRKQYAPSYKYIEDMSREEIEALPFKTLSIEERLAFYGDARGNIAFRDEVYYQPNFKAFSSLSINEKKKIDFESLYLEHKIELYGDKNKVIIGPNGVNYYPPNYKAWTSLTPDEKYEIDENILLPADKSEIYDAAGTKILKTSLRVSTKRIVLSEADGHMIDAFEVNTNASTFDFSISDPELLTAVKSGNKLIVSPNGATQDVEVSIIITAQAQGQQVSSETVTVFIDFIDDVTPIEPDEPAEIIEDVKIIVSPSVLIVKENEINRFSYYVSNGKAPVIEVENTGIADVFTSKSYIAVVGKMAGKTSIALSVYNDEGTEIVSKIDVPIIVEKASTEEAEDVLEVNTNSLTMKVGETSEILVSTNDENYSVKSTDESVISVEKKNYIVYAKALKNGIANVIITTNKTSGKSTSITISGYVEQGE